MSNMPSDKTTALAKELKELISHYDHRSFTAHISHLANIHVRHKRNVILKSPIRQLMYLVSLYHNQCKSSVWTCK